MTVASFGEETSLPSGTIAIWAGLLSDIPSGWVLCDGNNGTPNLLGEFVESIPDTSTSPGNTTAGKNSISLSTSQIPSHSHSGGTDSSGSHDHYVGNAGDVDGYGTTWIINGGTNYDDSLSAGDQSHTHNINSFNNTGSGNSIDNRPSFYEVAFIMKV